MRGREGGRTRVSHLERRLSLVAAQHIVRHRGIGGLGQCDFREDCEFAQQLHLRLRGHTQRHDRYDRHSAPRRPAGQPI